MRVDRMQSRASRPADSCRPNAQLYENLGRPGRVADQLQCWPSRGRRPSGNSAPLKSLNCDVLTGKNARDITHVLAIGSVLSVSSCEKDHPPGSWGSFAAAGCRTSSFHTRYGSVVLSWPRLKRGMRWI